MSQVAARFSRSSSRRKCDCRSITISVIRSTHQGDERTTKKDTNNAGIHQPVRHPRHAVDAFVTEGQFTQTADPFSPRSTTDGSRCNFHLTPEKGVNLPLNHLVITPSRGLCSFWNFLSSINAICGRKSELFSNFQFKFRQRRTT